MLHKIDQMANADNVPYTRPALLTRIEEDGKTHKLLVRIEHEQASFVMQAKNALQENYSPQVGDELLVSGENFHCCYIIGVLEKVGHGANDPAQCVRTEQGAVATHQNIKGHDILSIEDEQGHLLFEYDVTEKKSRLYAAHGDLELTAPRGNIELVSGKNIHCSSIGGIVMESATAAQLRVATDDGNQSSLTITDKAALLSSKRVAMRAESGDFRILDTVFQGEQFKAVLERSKILVGKIETVAIRILERAKNVYREVEELQQTKANRIRTVVEGTFQLKSETTYIKSNKNVNIDGERIHLG